MTTGAGGLAAREPRGPLGKPHVHHRVTDSTNARAKELGSSGAPHGTLVTAERQTEGRGRQGRRWAAPEGRALLASVVIRPLGERDAALPLAVAVAVCEACERVAHVRCAIKWPNDVWIAERKVAGILVEGRPQERWAVVGVGVNVTTTAEELPPDLRGTATSLALAGGATAERSALLAALLTRLADRLEQTPDRVLAAWGERDALAGRRVSWDGGRGTARGVDQRGALLVDTDDGRVELDASEVHLASSAEPGTHA
jgi:BirA family transcriptional regulator, biotin operon repressor / biotin---[acetyl-CoA-carboxylase] ligase